MFQGVQPGIAASDSAGSTLVLEVPHACVHRRSARGCDGITTPPDARSSWQECVKLRLLEIAIAQVA
jgi:hypothetical protein